ncbi:ATP nucleotide 3'-pyrophosphokinase [Streptomyces spiramenti]|uniref:ATP nucleotide 3'-pyrophosphokinase n=1 Tax=Streptomyces spiramenti TaxID=2720606 RepID=A0ABX1AP12_9ACTN|nr:ATP nucleotide 3'-pyrophosphokinase [Streptomyces spiramenti]NJP68813.1 ATP nucleotide 3'-pyrophosphokinase [Streptomyces spiramenti]
MTFRRRSIRRALGTAAVLSALLSPTAAASQPSPAPGAQATSAPAPRSVQEPAWEGEGLTLDAEENAAVDEYLEQAAEAERRISPQLVRVAELTAAELVGFDNRLKTEDSLKRKVATWLDESPEKSVDAVLGEINDSVRYTLQWEDEDYTEGVADAADLLSAWRNAPVRWSNTWGATGRYQAINSTWREAATAHPYEVQFHTPASRAAATLTHPLYEEERLPSTSPERAAELREQQALIFGAVPVPEGAERLVSPGVSSPATRPVPVPVG